MMNVVSCEENFLNENKKIKKLHRNVTLNFKKHIRLSFIQECFI